MLFSIVVPVYNRPDEIQVLLECLQKQTYTNFEVIIVESGSEIKSDQVVESFKSSLNVHYYLTTNSGQGFSRNHGFARATGDYFVVLDSDILLEPYFLQRVFDGIKRDNLDCYGGPDKAHGSFTDVQKAINYTLTSFFTTGGIRGGANHVGKFYPRSFNMGFSRKVYEATQGFKIPFLGEDIELSARIMSLGFKVGLIEDAFVYHKRKTNFPHFYKQMHFFGRSRVNIYRMFPDSLKLTHFVPAVFTIYSLMLAVNFLIHYSLGLFSSTLYFLYIMLIFVDSTLKNNSLKIGLLSVRALFTQMFGYGLGFMEDFIKLKAGKLQWKNYLSLNWYLSF